MVGVRRDRGDPPAARRRPVQRRRCAVRRAHPDAGVVAGRRPLAGRPAPADRRDRPGARGRDDAALGLRAPRGHAEPGPRHPAAPDRRPRAAGARRAAAARRERRRRTTRPRPAGGRGERAGAARGAVVGALEHRPRRPVAGPGLRRAPAGRGVRRGHGHRRLHQRVPGVLERPSRQRDAVGFDPPAGVDVEFDDVLDIADAANQYAPVRPPDTVAGLAEGGVVGPRGRRLRRAG